jgi:hypothetical protein
MLAVWINLFWVVMLHSLAEAEQYAFCLFAHEGGDGSFLQNIVNFYQATWFHISG